MKPINIIRFKITNIKGKPISESFEIPDELESGKDYTLLLKGTVFKTEILENNDGTVDLLFKIAIPDNNIQIISPALEKNL